MYDQKFGKTKSNPLADVANKLKEGSGLGETNNSAATMYGAPVHMKGGNSQIGHVSGLNYGSPMHNEGHGAPEGHVHDAKKPDRYSFDGPVNPSNKNIKGKALRKAAKQAHKIAQQGYSSEAYSKGASGTKLTIGKQPGNKRNIISLRSNKAGVTSTYGAGGAVYDEANKNVSRRDIKKQLKESGSVTVSGGKVTSGTTATEKKYGSVHRDTRKANLKASKENAAKAKAEKIANLQKTRANRKAAVATKKSELATAKAARFAKIKEKRASQKANLEAKKALKQKNK